MKLSLNWLSDFVSFSEKNPEKIAERLTLGVAEVEHIEMQGALLEKCVIGKIVKLGKHPNADKLSLCTVETDQGKKQVVCGGTNLREGMLVAFAHVGAHVRNNEELLELKAMKLRGEVSEGMICAAGELELTELFPPKKEEGNRPVVDLGNDGYTVGQPLRDALKLSDTIFHIDNHAITHRPDLFSHIGFARECVALGLGTWKKKPETKAFTFTKDRTPFKFIVDDPKLMPRYLGCMIEISELGDTPDWMKIRLSAVGWRPLNLPIDITNFVASEVGVPLHSFDADDIRGEVHMRAAKKGEKIVTLDHKEHTLPAGALVLSDDEGIFDLLGIIGGLRSSTKEGTKHIYLHSASLDPLSIRRTVIATGHRTAAATVYEKGVPPVTTEAGFYRALELFLAHVPGAKVTSMLETFGDNGTGKTISLSPSRATHFLGREVSEKEATTILSALDFSVTVDNGVGALRGSTELTINSTPLQVTTPLHRLGDIRIEVDLFEEIAPIAGF